MTSDLLIDLQAPGMKRSPPFGALKDGGHKKSNVADSEEMMKMMLLMMIELMIQSVRPIARMD